MFSPAVLVKTIPLSAFVVSHTFTFALSPLVSFFDHFFLLVQLHAAFAFALYVSTSTVPVLLRLRILHIYAFLRNWRHPAPSASLRHLLPVCISFFAPAPVGSTCFLPSFVPNPSHILPFSSFFPFLPCPHPPLLFFPFRPILLLLHTSLSHQLILIALPLLVLTLIHFSSTTLPLSHSTDQLLPPHKV